MAHRPGLDPMQDDVEVKINLGRDTVCVSLVFGNHLTSEHRPPKLGRPKPGNCQRAAPKAHPLPSSQEECRIGKFVTRAGPTPSARDFEVWGLAGSENSILVLRQLVIEVPVPRQVRNNEFVTQRANGNLRISMTLEIRLDLTWSHIHLCKPSFSPAPHRTTSSR